MTKYLRYLFALVLLEALFLTTALAQDPSIKLEANDGDTLEAQVGDKKDQLIGGSCSNRVASTRRVRVMTASDRQTQAQLI